MVARDIVRFVSLICFLLIAAALIIAWNSPATGTEASIYSATPLIVWVFLGLSIFCGFAILVYQVYTRQYEINNPWIISLLLIMVPVVSILVLPTIRGYLLFGSGDPLTHLGLTSTILSTGHNPEQNLYPITHIFVSELSQILNIEPIILFRLTPALFKILYVVFMYLLAKTILTNKGQAILTTALAAVFPFGLTCVTPWGLAILVLPLALLLLVKSCRSQINQRNQPFKILFLIMLILSPIFHILLAFTLVLVLLAIWLPQKIWTGWRKQIKHINWNVRFIILSCLLLLVLSIGWLSQFDIWGQAISGFGIGISGVAPSTEDLLVPTEARLAQGQSHLEVLFERMQYAQQYGYSIIAQFFKVYGIATVCLLLALISFPILMRRLTVKPEFHNLFSWYGPLILCGLTLIALYMTNLPLPPSRLVLPMVVMATPLVGFVFHEILERRHHASKKSYLLPKLGLFFIPLILIPGYVNGTLTLYPSSYNYAVYERQLTRTEVPGMDWFLHNKDTSLGSVQINCAPFRYAGVLLTPEERATRTDIAMWYGYAWPPWHFGYPDNLTLGQLYTEDNYLVLLEFDKLVYQEIHPKMAKFRFYPSDFELLEQDSSLDKLYSNGGFDVLLIHASGE